MNSYTYQINKNDVFKIRVDLENRGFLFSEIPHAFFKASNKTLKVNISVYNSLKCLVQGKGSEEFIKFYLEPEILKNFSLGYEHLNFQEKIGMDESGKGDYFGPLVVASVFVGKEQFPIMKDMGVMDSKKITDQRIHPLAIKIRKSCSFEHIILMPLKYNELYAKFNNLNALMSWTHATCLKNLYRRKPVKNVLLDKFGPSWRVEEHLKKMGIDVDLEQRTKAESDMAVAAASIVARSLFLEKLDELSKTFDIKLPKGGGNQTIPVGKQFIKKYSVEELQKVAKFHFKNTDKIVNS